MAYIPPYNNTIISCVDDLICPGNSQCVYPNSTASKSQGICGCGPEWGNSGIHCDIFGATTNFKVVFHSLLSCIFVIILFLVLFDLSVLNIQKKLTTFDARVTTLVECALGCIASIIFHVFTAISAITPNDFVIINDATLGFWKTSTYFTVTSVTTVFWSFFLLAAMLNVSTLWLEVAIASNKFRKLNSPQLSRNYIILEAVTDIIMVLTLIITYAISPNLIGITLAPITSFISMGYAYSAFSIYRTINNQVSSTVEISELMDSSSNLHVEMADRKQKESKMKAALRRILVCAVIIETLIVLSMLVSSISSILGSDLKRVYISPNDISFTPIMFSASYAFQSLNFFTIYWYIHGNVKRDYQKSNSRTTTTTEAAAGAAIMNSPRSSTNPVVIPQ